MLNLKEVGKIKPKSSLEIKYSKIGLGFEKLDRDAFDPEKVYDRVCESGAKWARIQSGWQRTEHEKGVYNFKWIEDIIDNFVKRGVQPWVCLCYGNDLYNEMAKDVFGATGIPPTSSEEEKQAWINYVKAFVKKFGDRVTYFEIWNEPDWCWKTGVNAKEFGEFSKNTAIAIKEAKPDAKVIGGVICHREISFINTALREMAPYIDFISFHEYTHHERDVFEKVEALQAIARVYNPDIKIIQGESGSQSRGDGNGALRHGAWTEEKQAKQLARHTVADLMCDVHFTSYFSCVDMVEALGGVVGDLASYTDYGYFGILGAEFDGNVKPTGEYFKKKSFYVYQNVVSLFAEDIKPAKLPVMVTVANHDAFSKRIYDMLPRRYEITSGGFEREGGKAFAYWNPTNIMTTSYDGEMPLEFYCEYGRNFKLVDVMDGTIYEFPDELVMDMGDNVYRIERMPIKDTPLVLVMGEFII